MILVRTCFADERDDGAGVATEISRVGVSQNTKFLQCIGAEPVDCVRDVDGKVITVAAIEQKVVGLRTLTVYREGANLSGRHHACLQWRERQRVATVCP